jgi:hypothetical protein
MFSVYVEEVEEVDNDEMKGVNEKEAVTIRNAKRSRPYPIEQQQQPTDKKRYLILRSRSSEISKARYEYSAANKNISYKKKSLNLLMGNNDDIGSNDVLKNSMMVINNDLVENNSQEDNDFEFTTTEDCSLDIMMIDNINNNNNNNNSSSSDNTEEFLRICLSKIDTPIQYYGKFNFIELVNLLQKEKQMSQLILQRHQYLQQASEENNERLLKKCLYGILRKLFNDNKFNTKQKNDIINCANSFAHIINPNIELCGNDMNEIFLSGKQDPSIISYDCCPNGDHVYVFDTKKNHEIQCPQCKAQRYNKCTYPNCFFASSCNLNEHKGSKTPKKEIFYRSLIMLLHDLCSSKLFRGLIKYKTLTEIYSSRSENMYSDVMQSPHVLKHLREMASERDVKNVSHDESSRKIVPIDLILMEYYDGAQLFKSIVKNFCPLMISILNLPPTLRKVVNLGMFTITVFTGGKRDAKNPNLSNSEQFTIGKCFVDELLTLDSEGILVNDLDDNSIIYHVKARLISHVYDTAEIQHICQFQGVQSSSGCALCRTTQGRYNKELGASCFLGHRRMLPLDHFLRYKGQTLQCCPSNFYAPSELIKSNAIDDLPK